MDIIVSNIHVVDIISSHKEAMKGSVQFLSVGSHRLIQKIVNVQQISLN